MRRIIAAGLAAAVFTVVAGAVSTGDDAGGRGLRPKRWTLTPDAEALLAEWAKAPYRRLSDHTALFVRAQLKYGINRNDFLHHWYDRPLLQDSSLGQRRDSPDERKPWLNLAGWKKTVEMGRLGKQDGFAVFTFTKNRDEVLPASLTPGSEATILVEIATSTNLDEAARRAREALDAPNSFRLGGKVVMTSYPAISRKHLPQFVELKRRLKEQLGDKFIIMPYCSIFEGRNFERIDAQLLTETRERLRFYLRALDGLYYNARESFSDRRYDPWLFETVMIPLIHATLAEPEFAGKKYLGCWSTPGHENSYRWNKGLDSTGTRMLRDQLVSIEKLRPDFMIGCEWDEENENTCFRPTVANGFTHQRLLRYFADRWAERKPELFPGDRTDEPNLVLSYRKDLMAGEPVEVEVLNIPDGSFKGAELKVAFAWKDAAGNVLQKFTPRTIKADELGAVWFTCDASDLVQKAPAAIPVLGVEVNDRRFVYSAGFWPLGLHASRALEQKWVKQPVRDLPRGVEGAFRVEGPDADGLYSVKGRVKGPAPFRSVELRDGPDTVWMAGGEDHRPGWTTVKIALQGSRLNGKTGPFVDGTISVRDASGAVLSMNRTRGGISVSGDSFVFKNAESGVWPTYLYVDVPESSAATARLCYDLTVFGKGELALADLARKGVYACGGSRGRNLVFTHYLSARSIPPPQMKDDVAFDFKVRPDSPRSLFRLEAIDANYRVWRSAPVSIVRPSGKSVTYHVYERDLDTVSAVTLDSARVPHFACRFDKTNGSVVPSSDGRGMWGIRRGYAPLVTGYGQGETGYGNIADAFMTESMLSTADYWSFGQQIVPTMAGFRLRMKVRPRSPSGRQGLLSTGKNGFNLYLENGLVKASFFLRNVMMRVSGRKALSVVTGGLLKVGEWNMVELVYDQRTAVLSVNGEAGPVAQFAGDVFYPMPTAVGAGRNADEFFEGDIDSLTVELN